MGQRRIVVISGKTCSGKSSLAELLRSEYNFVVVRSRDILTTRLNLEPEHADRQPLIDKAIEEDAQTSSHWVLNGVKAFLGSLPAEKSIVVDQVSTPEQVLAFRREFGDQLAHVHLYASQDTLQARYERADPAGAAATAYEVIDHLKDNKLVVWLKWDADVRINTTRTDARDCLVRVAARLKLFAPAFERYVDVLIGGQFGSEGKGNIAAYLAQEYDVLVRVGGPNAGHTIATPDGKNFVHHHLPSGCEAAKGRILLGPGTTIRVPSLLEEIAKCEISPKQLFIDPQAAIIEDEDREAEKSTVVGAIASTGSGSGSASARRILNRGHKVVKLAKDVPELRPYVGTEGHYHGRTLDRLEEAYRSGHSVLLEGTQGSGLSIFHGEYPWVTSRDTNVAGCLAEAGISPGRVRRVIMVVRTTPIRVGDPDGDQGKTSGRIKHETDFETIAKAAKLDGETLVSNEITSTTKRNRRVGWFDWEQFRTACMLNTPTDIVLTFADYLHQQNTRARRFEQLHEDTIKFVQELERVAQAPVSLINTRFLREGEDFLDRRTTLDRRTWSGKRR